MGDTLINPFQSRSRLLKSGPASRSFLLLSPLAWNTFLEFAVVKSHRYVDTICHISKDSTISGCPSVSHLPADSFFELVVVENFAFDTTITIGLIGLLTLEAFGCMSQRERKISPVFKQFLCVWRHA